MRTYILSENERKIIETYMETGLNLNGFNVLKLRITRALPQLEEDLKLIKKFIEKFEIIESR